MKLTDRAIERLLAPDASGKPRIHWDDDLKGFGVLVSGVTSAKSYVVQRKLPDGRTRRVTVERVELIKLEEARDRAMRLLADIGDGRDPKAKAKPDATLRDALDDYVKKPKLRERSRAGYRAAVERHLSDWLDRPLRSIGEDEVRDRHGEIRASVDRGAADGGRSVKRTGEATADGVMRTLRAIYNHASLSDWPRNPVRLRGRWHNPAPRDGHVSAEDLPKFYRAVTSLPNAVHRDYLLFVLFTGLRREEAASLRWAHVDLKRHAIRVPAELTKGDREVPLPMSDYVLALLKGRREAVPGGEFVFPSNAGSGHVSEPKFPLNQVRLACGVKATVHDLRRTFATVAAEAGVHGIALKALMKHSTGGDVTEDYIRELEGPVRAAAQRVADALKRLCGVEQR